MIGAAGLTDNIHTEIDIALNFHELIKVRLTSDKNTREEIVNSICSKSNSVAVQTIGHILILFKQVKEPKIILPKD